MVLTLNTEFSIEEIKVALWSINDSSSPGPDGFNSRFYKIHWNSLKNLISVSLNHIFRTGEIIKEWNHTFLYLIPKNKFATKIQDFRPIAWCNTMYKVLTKICPKRWVYVWASWSQRTKLLLSRIDILVMEFMRLLEVSVERIILTCVSK